MKISEKVVGLRQNEVSTGHKRWHCTRGTSQKQEMPENRVNREPPGREQGETMLERGALERWKTMSGIVGSASGSIPRCIISGGADWPARAATRIFSEEQFRRCRRPREGRPARPMGGSLVRALNPTEHGGLWPPEGSGSPANASRRLAHLQPTYNSLPTLSSYSFHRLAVPPHPSSPPPPPPFPYFDYHYSPHSHLLRGHQAMDCEFFILLF